jgi:tripartite motif-containing protein 71
MKKYVKIFPPMVIFLSFLFPLLIPQETLQKDITYEWNLIRTVDGTHSPSGSFQEIIAIDLDNEGSLYILDRGRNRLLKYASNGLFLKEIGGFGNGAEQFDDPRDVDAHLTLNVFVADYNNSRIVRFDSHLNYLNELKTSYQSPAYFEFPLSIAVNGQYDVFLLEDVNKSILKFNRFNDPLAVFGSTTENIGQLLGPYQLSDGAKNEIFVCDPLKKSIMVFDYLGNFVREISHPGFQELKGISVSHRNELAVADLKGGKIYFFENGYKFTSISDLQYLNIKPIDVSLWHPRGAKKRTLFVADAQRCTIFGEK